MAFNKQKTTTKHTKAQHLNFTII